MKTLAPSPTGTNRANLFLDGRAAQAVRHGRALQGAAYDHKFGLARDEGYAPKNLDQMLADETIKSIKDALTKAGIDQKVIEATVRALCGADPQGVMDDDKDTNKSDRSSSTQAVAGEVAGDDPPDFQGRPNKGAAPSPSKGTVAKDGRPAWLRSVNPNAQGDARQRALGHMKRIGHCW